MTEWQTYLTQDQSFGGSSPPSGKSPHVACILVRPLGEMVDTVALKATLSGCQFESGSGYVNKLIEQK